MENINQFNQFDEYRDWRNSSYAFDNLPLWFNICLNLDGSIKQNETVLFLMPLRTSVYCDWVFKILLVGLLGLWVIIYCLVCRYSNEISSSEWLVYCIS